MSDHVTVGIGVNATKLTQGLSLAGANVRSWAAKLSTVPIFGGAMAGALGGMAGAGAIIHGVEGVIKKGAELNRLSRMTDLPVGELFQVQKGLSAVGADAGTATSMLYRMQKAIGGINDEGDSTKDVFAKIGIDLVHLKTLSTGQRFSTVMRSLGTLPSEEAAFASGKIFGRGGGMEAMNVARSYQQFDQAFRDAKGLGEIYQEQAASMQQVEHAIRKLGNATQAFMLGLTQSLMPEILAAAEASKNVKTSAKWGYWAGEFGKTGGMASIGPLGPALTTLAKVLDRLLPDAPQIFDRDRMVAGMNTILGIPGKMFGFDAPDYFPDGTKAAKQTSLARSDSVGYEHMGARYSGFSGGNDHQQEIAQNTARSAGYLERIASDKRMASREFFLDDAYRRGWESEMSSLGF